MVLSMHGPVSISATGLSSIKTFAKDKVFITLPEVSVQKKSKRSGHGSIFDSCIY